jgi:hypothetical protein
MPWRRRSATDIDKASRVPLLTERTPSLEGGVATHLPDLFAEHGPVVQPVSVGVDDGVGEPRADLLGARMTVVAHRASLAGTSWSRLFESRTSYPAMSPTTRTRVRSELPGR